MARLAHRAAASTCAAVLISIAAPARAQSTTAPAPHGTPSLPPADEHGGKMNPPLAIGLGILGLSWVPSAIVGFVLTAHDEERALPLAVPVAGPLIAMELLPVKPEARWIFAAASGVQAAGVVTLVVGLLLPDDVSMPEKLYGLHARAVVTEQGAGLQIGRAF